MNGPPPTPVPIPPAMRSWGSRINGTQAATKRTPTKPQGRPAVYFATPRHEDVKSVPEQPVFKGFENSFMQASPARSPSKPKGRAYARGSSPLVEYSDMYVPDKKGKGKEKLPPIVNSPSFFKVAQSTQKQKQNEFVEPNDDIEMGDISPPRLNIDRSSPGVDTADMSVAGETDVLDDADTISRDDLEPLEAMDWTEEVSIPIARLLLSADRVLLQFKRLLLTHFSKSSSTLTIHVLLSVSVSNSTYRNSANSYQAACTGLLECIASRHYSLESTSTTAAQCFITMLRVLVEVVDVSRNPRRCYLLHSLSSVQGPDGVDGVDDVLLSMYTEFHSGIAQDRLDAAWFANIFPLRAIERCCPRLPKASSKYQ